MGIRRVIMNGDGWMDLHFGVEDLGSRELMGQLAVR